MRGPIFTIGHSTRPIDEFSQLLRSNGVQRVISVRLLAEQNLLEGDWVLVHVGFAMAKIDEREAQLTLDQVKKMGEDYLNEIDAFNSSQIA